MKIGFKLSYIPNAICILRMVIVIPIIIALWNKQHLNALVLIAIAGLSDLILRLQGDGDKEGVITLMQKDGSVTPALQEDLDKLSTAGIPVDVVFEQGLDVLGLVQ